MASQAKDQPFKKYLCWFLLCTIIFVASTFAHECGHGLSFALIGQPVSTGFNRIGNAYTFPKDADFRTNLNLDANSLNDLGVPVTLLLAITFTVIYRKYRVKSTVAQTAILSVALCNSLIRLVPALHTCILPVFTGKPHMEDELQTGLVLQRLLGVNAIAYLPPILSIVISGLCLFFIIRKVYQVGIQHFKIYASVFIGAYILSFVLDNYIRINWIF